MGPGSSAGTGAAGPAATSVAASATTAGTAAGTTASAGPGAATTSGGTPDANAQGVPPCPSSGLRLAEGATGAAAGSSYTQLDFTNDSGVTCTLYGYPGVALTTGVAPGSQVGAAAARSDARPATLVTLTPGATAVAQVQLVDVLNYPTGNCDPASASYLQVYPPGQTMPLYLSFSAKGCAKPVFTLGVTTVYPQTGA